MIRGLDGNDTCLAGIEAVALENVPRFFGVIDDKRTVLMSDVSATEMARMFTPSRPSSSLTWERAPGVFSRLMDNCVMTISYSLT